jgi:hypothetical protein
MLPFPVRHDLFPVEHRFIELDGAVSRLMLDGFVSGDALHVA